MVFLSDVKPDSQSAEKTESSDVSLIKYYYDQAKNHKKHFTIFIQLPIKTTPKNLDPSFKTDLDFGGCCGRDNPILKRYHRRLVKIFGVILEGGRLRWDWGIYFIAKINNKYCNLIYTFFQWLHAMDLVGNSKSACSETLGYYQNSKKGLVLIKILRYVLHMLHENMWHLSKTRLVGQI